MPPALGPRFVLEAGFLVLLAVVVGFAELDAWLIVLVMAAGWVLVSLIEYFAWRQSLAYATDGRYAASAEPAVVHEEVVEDIAPPPPPPPPPAPPAEEATMVAPVAERPEEAEVPEEASSDEQGPAEANAPAEAETTPAETEPEEPKEFRAEPERAPHRLEPLQPRPRRRWVVFGSRERPPTPGDGGRAEEE
jgi:hypothetical protein